MFLPLNGLSWYVGVMLWLWLLSERIMDALEDALALL